MSVRTSKNSKKARKWPRILGVQIDSRTIEEVLSWTWNSLAKKNKAYIVTPNPEILVYAASHPDYKDILNKADIRIPDGMGVSLFSGVSVVRGREVFERIISENRKIKVFLLGAREFVNKKSVGKINKLYSNITVKGESGPVLNELGKTESERDTNLLKDIVDKINLYRPDIIFVAFGHPKQEYFISEWLPKINVKVAMAVGGALDYFVGQAKLPPKWMANIGLEWLWRLLQEPYRWRRIVNAVIVFPVKVLVDRAR